MITCAVCGEPATLAPIESNSTAGAFPSGVVYTNTVDRPYCAQHKPTYQYGQTYLWQAHEAAPLTVIVCGVCGQPATTVLYDTTVASSVHPTPVKGAYCQEHGGLRLYLKPTGYSVPIYRDGVIVAYARSAAEACDLAKAERAPGVGYSVGLPEGE